MRRTVITVLLAPDALFREGLLRILSSTSYRVAIATSSCDELRISSSEKRQLLFIVAAGSNTPEVVDIVARLHREFEAARVAVLAATCDQQMCCESLRAGASAYLLNSTTADALVKSLDLVMAGGMVVPSELVRHFVGCHEATMTAKAKPQDATTVPPAGLSPPRDELARCLSLREREILTCIVEGDSNKHIGRRFTISEATVKVHVKAILRKISARNRTQAAIWAMTHHVSAPTTSRRANELPQMDRCDIAPSVETEPDPGLSNGWNGNLAIENAVPS